MGSHPLNLTLRFLLELVAITSIGVWGWNKSEHVLRYVLALGLPLLFATMWGVFAVPGDPSRSGQTVIATSGLIRLLLELGLFSVAALALYDLGHTKISYTFAVIVVIHYLISYDRISWLLDN